MIEKLKNRWWFYRVHRNYEKRMKYQRTKIVAYESHINGEWIIKYYEPRQKEIFWVCHKHLIVAIIKYFKKKYDNSNNSTK